MTGRYSRLLDSRPARRTVTAIEGGSGRFDVVALGRAGRRQALCALVRSAASRRVYLLIREPAPVAADWRQDSEIIGFEALQPLLRLRPCAAPRRAA
jgi:hypothetical protein